MVLFEVAVVEAGGLEGFVVPMKCHDLGPLVEADRPLNCYLIVYYRAVKVSKWLKGLNMGFDKWLLKFCESFLYFIFLNRISKKVQSL